MLPNHNESSDPTVQLHQFSAIAYENLNTLQWQQGHRQDFPKKGLNLVDAFLADEYSSPKTMFSYFW